MAPRTLSEIRSAYLRMPIAADLMRLAPRCATDEAEPTRFRSPDTGRGPDIADAVNVET